MDIVLDYYGFSSFFNDSSGVFSNHKISYLALNKQHVLVFELTAENKYNLHVAKYLQLDDVGKKSPEIIETIVEDYNKSNPEHRLALRAYVD